MNVGAQTEWFEQSDRFRHEALLYRGEEDFVRATSAFVRAGLKGGEPALVVVAGRKIEALREALGGDAEDVYFADMSKIGRNPARIIPAWHEFVAVHGSPGVRLRGIGEPFFPGRSDDELVECQRHESLLNLAFAEGAPFWLLCPYDTEALEPTVVDAARRSHPFVTEDGRSGESTEYERVDVLTGPFAPPLSDPPGDATELNFEAVSLDGLRRLVADRAGEAGLGEGRRIQLAVAANEIAANSVRHGGGRGILRIWRHGPRVVCDIRDGGRIDDPLADRRVPSLDQPGGRGLWIANQLCDLVQVRSGPAGTAVRLHMTAG